MIQDSASTRVRTHLERVVAGGRPGDRLPSVRALMAELGVAPATVRDAMRDLTRAGVIVTVPGSGTFVAARRQARAEPGRFDWQTALLAPADPGPDPVEALRASTAPGVIDLASGYPDAALQPEALLARAARSALRRPGVFGRAPANGVEALTAWFAAELGGHDGHRVLVTSGGQAALSLVFRSIGLPGDQVLVESPTYVGALTAIRAAGLVPRPVPVDDDGVGVDLLADAVAATGARLLYLQPRFQNPTGSTLPPERRVALMELADRHGLVVVEDDWLADLDASGTPALAADDPDGHVVHVRSLTKSIAPGVRVAGVAARGAIAHRLQRARANEDFFVAPLLQEIALGVVTASGWPAHLAALRAGLLARRNALADALRALDHPLATAELGGGPLHAWLRLPPGTDESAVRDAAARHGLALVVGRQWFAGDPSGPHVRLAFGAADPARIQEGIARLQRALHEVDTTSA